jgi:hypothetical protein
MDERESGTDDVEDDPDLEAPGVLDWFRDEPARIFAVLGAVLFVLAGPARSTLPSRIPLVPMARAGRRPPR